MHRRLALASVIVLAGSPALAQTATPGATSTTTPAAATPAASGSFLDGLMRQQNLLSDIGGLRGIFAAHGITLNATDVEEVLGNVAGGIKNGFTYDALTTVTLQIDTATAFGLRGGLFNVSALQIRGRNLSPYYLGNLQTASGIEAEPTTRLWELWYQQGFADGAFDVKLGQQSIDQEFMVSQGASLFINTMMGWPLVPSDDLYAGGPAYPMSSLGVRLRGQPGHHLTLLGGVFDDNPPGGPFDDDDQLRGNSRWGGNFSLRTGALFIGEIQYALNQADQGEMEQPGTPPPGLPGTYKLGFWYDTASFPSPRYGNDGLSLADPASDGVPKMIRGNYSLYAVADQTVWQAADGPRSLAVFARVMGAPDDRNAIDFSLNAGLTLKAPFAGRDDDTAGIGLGIGHVASAASGLVRDTNYYDGANAAVPATETMVELTYQLQLAPWLIVQPDMQYVIRPGGGVQDPSDPSRTLRDELVVGARSTITF